MLNNNTTLAADQFIDPMERTLENIIGFKNNKKQLLTQDISTIIEYDGISKILKSNNLIFTEKHKIISIYCIIQNSEIGKLDFSEICHNNIVRKFKVFLMYKENKIPNIITTYDAKVNIISYNDLNY